MKRSRRRTKLSVRRTFTVNVASAIFLAGFLVFGCSDDGTAPNESGAGPEASPRPGGATLLFSPSGPVGARASAQNPAFSPDGGRLVFTLFRNGYNRGPAELWIVGADGGGFPPRATGTTGTSM